MNRWFLVAAVAIQLFCLILFVGDILVSITGLAIINWRLHELIEIGAAAGLILGTVVGIIALRQALRRADQVEDKLRAASGAFSDLMKDRFSEWGLTPAEADVAQFAIKGLSSAEIAGLRNTSEGTVKAQTAAIYRKAGVSGRSQLMSLFIDDLMDGPLET